MKIKIDGNGEPHILKPDLYREAAPSEAHAFGWCMRTLLRRGEQGQSLVEFALIAPMLLLLATGIMVFGQAMNNYLQLTNAVSIGARTLAVSAGVALDPCAVGSTAIQNAAPRLKTANLTYSFTLNGVAYNNQSTCSSSSTTTGAAGNLASGTTVTVTATYPLNLAVFGKVFSQNNAVLSSSATELVQ